MLIVSTQQLRRIVQEAARRKLDEGFDIAAPALIEPLEGSLTQSQLQSVIDEEFALALVLRGGTLFQ